MKEIELPIDLIQLILENKSNTAFLKKLADYAFKLREKDDWWDDLTENQKHFVHKSAQQIDEGKVVPNATVREEIKQRLRRP